MKAAREMGGRTYGKEDKTRQGFKGTLLKGRKLVEREGLKSGGKCFFVTRGGDPENQEGSQILGGSIPQKLVGKGKLRFPRKNPKEENGLRGHLDWAI